MSFFKFDDKYKNTVPFGRSRFLKFAQPNLSQKEYSLLENHLTDYQIEYILPCRNGEQVAVVNATVDSKVSNVFTEVSSALLMCLPHEMLLYLHSGTIGKVYTARRELQKNNAGRANILSKETSYTFPVDNLDGHITQFRQKAEKTAVSKLTASEIVSLWSAAIQDLNKEHRRACYIHYRPSQVLYSDLSLVEHDDPRSYYEMKTELVEELCALVYPLWCVYLEQTELVDVSAERWISCYLEAANEYVRDIAYTGLNDNDAHQIVEAYELACSQDNSSQASIITIRPDDLALHMYSLHPELWETR